MVALPRRASRKARNHPRRPEPSIEPPSQRAPAQDASGAQDTTLGAVLTGAALRGAEVLALAWRNIASLTSGNLDRLHEAERLVAALAAAAARRNGTNRVEAHLDARGAAPTGSIHQKLVLVRGGATRNKTVAYVGGIDFCESRWDRLRPP